MKQYLFILLFLFSITGNVFSQTGNPQQYKYVFTVAKDGSGDYKYIQDAIDAMRVYPLMPITLYIKNGVYNEKIELPASNTDVTFIGQSVDSTIITFNDHTGRGKINTFTSFTAKIVGNRFRAENITFVNSSGPVGQAVALHVESDRAVFVNCRFLGNQDTIYASGENSRQYFYNCYIEGTTDFIFGPATTVFEACTIHSKTNSYVTAASTTPGKKYGYVFIDCKLTAAPGVDKVYLGRPWRAHAKTVFVRCQLGSHIVPEGWENWGNVENEKTAYYAEYKCTGPGAVRTGRVKWAKELSDKEAQEYTVEKVLGAGSTVVVEEPVWYQKKRDY
ncbi:pectinesterase family protein [Chitinophagaceae bacterium LB-8]|uniref:Pectinesterase n=1 Tax=Paraflavisolibacter caeni TaxID=2982496 RepID=A0A9X2Y061_9BACT|nr:pectinesterase family protein [Paraflavisolibacter caeni]MCU7552671.1 pectinesterase family protein [Paraflavisolibacter caeni]